ncbi:NAD(P)H pyrophosphatase NUDT13, mitochondrial isoform X3 [Athene noctua]|uniref:NAD(P)H pyrophosphatase NUDT13, mitochondrial isoform X3 n=1 Tax=Athene noctua TaxID=126797 RepID=UPI003EBCD1C0
MAAIYQAVYRRASSLMCRFHSTYVRKIRYLNDLKEDDSLCRQAQTSGTFYLFHNLSPFLQEVGKQYLVPQVSAAEIKRILEKFKEAEQWIEKSVLIGCSDEHVPHFALDLGALEKSVIESELKGSFTDLRKALFVVDQKDSPLLASAQSLLRWHDSHQYCSKTGQPTQKNVAGSKRVCHASGIIYYPQMSPVVITLVSDGSRCLLARQPSFPQGMYSALSGFCDMGENVEETVRREVAEEISMNSLELEEARWFDLEEIMKGLKRKPGSSKQEDGSLLPWFPPKQAIAHQLIWEWVKQQTSQLA